MAHATQFRFRSASRPRFAQLALVLAASGLFGVACGSGSGVSGVSHVSADPKLGNTDKPDNGVVSVDEPNITGSIDGTTLAVNVPVTSLVDHDTTGTLKLRLQDVDGLTDRGVVDLPYSLAAGESATLSGTLTAPTDASTQSDFVKSNVRVDDGSPGGLRVTRSLMYVLPLDEVTVEGPSTVHKGREVSYRVRVQDGIKHQPISDRKVTFELRQNDKVVQTQTISTQVTGDAEARLTLKNPGDYKVLAHLESQGVSIDLQDPVTVSNDVQKLLLTTDKPIYQPGQVINLRALSLTQGSNTPSAAAAVSFEVEDGKGNKLLKQATKTDQYGVASTKFQLGSILNEGTFKVRVIQGTVISEKTVQVSHYALPKFAVTVKTADPWYAPGAKLQGSVDSSYFFGKTVTGSVLVQAYSLDVGETMFQQVMGSLDANGHYDFSLSLPSTLPGLPLDQGNAAIELRVTVTDSAGQAVQKSLPVTVSAQGMNLSLVPESTDLVPGIANKLLLFASDPLGAPLAGATATVSAPDGSTLKATTDDYGQAEIGWTPDGATKSPAAFQATVALSSGKSASANFSFGAQSGSDHLVVRTDKSVYQVGDTVQVSVVSTEPTGNLYVDWINDGQAVDMRTLTAADGTAKFTMPLDASLIGSNRIDAYLVDGDGNVVRSGRTIFARTDAALNIAVSADKAVYNPGDPAKLTLSVTDETGAPKAAALGLQIVDEAVFSLVDAKPGLLRTYFELNDQLATPSYELNAPASDLSELLFTDTAAADKKKSAAAQRQTEGALAAMKNQSLTGISHNSLADVLKDAVAKLQPSYTALRPTLLLRLTPGVTAAVAGLALQHCTPNDYYCSSLNVSFTQALASALQKSTTLYDFWGNAYTIQDGSGQFVLTTLGPDEKAGTADDSTFSFSYSELGLPQVISPGLNEGAGPAGAPATAAGGATATTAPGDTGTGAGNAAPRVRSDFPETLYVNPSVITDATGKATVDVSMADSITQWRVSALASSADGRLGGTESGLRVFQDFFIDVNFPASLTRGDEVEFPIAVYNYLDTPQTVALELDPGTWYTPLGSASTSVALQPGQVIGVSFPVRVDEVGLRTLTVKAVGDKFSDAVARTVRVVPDGKAFPSSDAGSLASGTVTASATFPVGSVAGSETMYLDVFPAFLSQVVQGMDSILATPNGCFEQTTSSAWPNVLATEYMTETKQITPAIQLKAEALMSTGYQRLLTFEHKTGGYSWFGDQDPAPYLSVTAFGLMEFSDMAQVQQVDDAMMKRTHDWLVAQQKPDGSFLGDRSESFSFQTSTVRNTAFTAWALASYGDTGAAVQSALSYVKANLGSDSDAYTLGIVANAYALAAPSDPELALVLSKLDANKKSDGSNVYWDSGGTQTNFYGAGDDAAVCSTALVAYALISTGTAKASVDGALAYLASKKDANGNFGSTQATIWSLRALILAARKGTQGAVGNLNVSVDSAPTQAVALSAAQSDVMTRIDLSTLASAGSHAVKLDFAGSGKVSYNLVSGYNVPWAAVPPDPAGPLSIDVAYDKDTLFVNDSVTATVEVVNNEAVTENMLLITLGIAPGFSVDTAGLEQYLSSGVISKYEVTGQQLILYVTALDSKATLNLSYKLTATMPVTAVDGGAEVKLYYQPEKRARVAAHGLTAKKQ
jgi:alpha-2-macroglobulin-like protein